MVQSLFVRTRRFGTGSHPIHGVMGLLAEFITCLFRETTLTLARVGATGVGAANPLTAAAGFLGGLAHLRIILVGCVAPDLQRVLGGTAGM